MPPQNRTNQVFVPNLGDFAEKNQMMVCYQLHAQQRLLLGLLTVMIYREDWAQPESD